MRWTRSRERRTGFVRWLAIMVSGPMATAARKLPVGPDTKSATTTLARKSKSRSRPRSVKSRSAKVERARVERRHPRSRRLRDRCFAGYRRGCRPVRPGCSVEDIPSAIERYAIDPAICLQFSPNVRTFFAGFLVAFLHGSAARRPSRRRADNAGRSTASDAERRSCAPRDHPRTAHRAFRFG